jgi:hypothetical protein
MYLFLTSGENIHQTYLLFYYREIQLPFSSISLMIIILLELLGVLMVLAQTDSSPHQAHSLLIITSSFSLARECMMPPLFFPQEPLGYAIPNSNIGVAGFSLVSVSLVHTC